METVQKILLVITIIPITNISINIKTITNIFFLFIILYLLTYLM